MGMIPSPLYLGWSFHALTRIQTSIGCLHEPPLSPWTSKVLVLLQWLHKPYLRHQPIQAKCTFHKISINPKNIKTWANKIEMPFPSL